MTTLNPDHFDCSVTFGELVANGGGTTDIIDETGTCGVGVEDEGRETMA